MKNVTRTIRLEDEVDIQLRERAREEGVSVSYLVNKMARRYIDWEIPAEKFGTIQVAAVLLDRLYDGIDVQKSEELGRWMAHEFFEPFARYLFGEFTFETSIEVFKRMSRYSGGFVFDNTSSKKGRKLVLRHNASLNIAAYYAGILQGVYGELLKFHIKINSTQDLCVVQIDVP